MQAELPEPLKMHSVCHVRGRLLLNEKLKDTWTPSKGREHIDVVE